MGVAKLLLRRFCLQVCTAGDGENLLAAFRGRQVVRTSPIFWQWLGTRAEPDWWPRLAVRDGDWKLLLADGGRAELHRLDQDRAEGIDVAAEHPEVVARLTGLAEAWRASLPETPNPACIAATEPDEPAAGRRRRQPRPPR